MNFPSTISKFLLLNNFKFPLNNSYKVLPTLTSPMIILQPASLQKKPYANLVNWISSDLYLYVVVFGCMHYPLSPVLQLPL